MVNMKKILCALLLCSSTAVFAIGDTDSFYSTSGAIVRIGDTKSELLEKMKTNKEPTYTTIYNERGYALNVESYTFVIETMIYKVYLFRGKIIKMTSNYS